jgi:hypothetical protein
MALSPACPPRQIPDGRTRPCFQTAAQAGRTAGPPIYLRLRTYDFGWCSKSEIRNLKSEIQNPMRQPIAGVAPPELAEVAAMTVWPTIGATAPGRWVGRLAANRLGLGGPLSLGNLLAVATIPVSLAVFAWQLMPYVCRRYALTNRRLILRRGLRAVDERWIGLDEFDAVEIEVLPGQEWLHAGEVIFKRGANEALRFSGVSRPEVFRRVCLKARDAVVLVRKAVQQQVPA